jgi:CRISPR-associated protein Csm1
MDKTLIDLTIGSLLHDVGKVVQRASSKMDGTHSEYGGRFIKKIKLQFNSEDIIRDCVALHHKSDLKKSEIEDNNPAYVTYEADNIAAGIDRRADHDTELTKGFDRELVLRSVFGTLKTASVKDDNDNDYGYRLRVHNPDSGINYPEPMDKIKIKAPRDIYQKIQESLEQDLIVINDFKPPGAANSLLGVLEKNLMFVPSSTNTSEIADISLFDHVKLTAAVAGCMYQYIKEEKETDNFKKWCLQAKRDEPYFLLVSGDLSGVQDFIYTIASKQAMKSLRSRSFYLDILLEHISDEILEKLGLSRASLLYTGGGHFYLLLPNTKKVKNLLERTKEKVNDWFLNNFGITLYLSLAHSECTSNQLMGADGKRRLPDVFREVGKKLSMDKAQRYSENQLSSIFDPDSGINSLKDDDRECASCRTSGSSLQPDDEFSFMGLSENICQNCRNFAAIGKTLILNRDILMFVSDNKMPDDHYLELPSIDDSPCYLVFMLKNRFTNNSFPHRRVYLKNSAAPVYGIKNAINLYVGDYNPTLSNEELITFEELENRAKKRGAFGRLAVFRADVDNLGNAFSKGFRGNQATISRFATLSRNLSLFFKSYINNICAGSISSPDKKMESFKFIDNDCEKTEKDLIIVYSGGDDVFIVGAWDHVLEFTIDLRRVFREFTSDKLTFSAGAGFFGHSFPVYQMAELTGKLESTAKDFEKAGKPPKDSIALFGKDKSAYLDSDSAKNLYVFKWDDIEESVLGKLKYFIDEFTYRDKQGKLHLDLSAALLYRLMTLLKMERGPGGINLARLAYTLARLEKPGAAAHIRQKLEKLKNNIYKWAQESG